MCTVAAAAAFSDAFAAVIPAAVAVLSTAGAFVSAVAGADDVPAVAESACARITPPTSAAEYMCGPSADQTSRRATFTYSLWRLSSLKATREAQLRQG